MAIDGLLGLAQRSRRRKGAVALLPSMPAWAFGADGRRRAVAVAVETRGAAARAGPDRDRRAGARRAPAPDLLVTGDGRHLAVVERTARRCMLRDRAGDYVRSLLAEASGFDGDPTPLDDAAVQRIARAIPASRCLRKAGGEWRVLATRSATRIDWAADDRGLRRGRHRRFGPPAAARLQAALAQARPRRARPHRRRRDLSRRTGRASTASPIGSARIHGRNRAALLNSAGSIPASRPWICTRRGS